MTVCKYHNIKLKNSKVNRGTYCPSCFTEKYYKEPQPMKTGRNKFMKHGKRKWTESGGGGSRVHTSRRGKSGRR